MANHIPEELLAVREPPSAEKQGKRLADVERPIPCEVIGRYTLYAQIGSGGMASVHLGWLTGAADFSRVVAIKRMHPQLALDAEFATRFRDEAWISARLLHPNIVQVLDVVEWNRELLIVMEYVDGVSLRALWGDANSAGCRLPPNVVAGILVPVLHGLHAAHLATDDDGRPLGIVHRDFSPQNIMVTREGHAKVLDFGVAKARTHLHVTFDGQLSGKAGYLSPEQVLAGTLDCRTDVFAAGIVLWEMLTGHRLFREPGREVASSIHRVLNHTVRPPSEVNPEISPELDRIVLRALERDPDLRFASARELALELEAAVSLASASTVAAWVERLCGAGRMAWLSRVLASTRRSATRTPPEPVAERVSTVVDTAIDTLPSGGASSVLPGERTPSPQVRSGPRRSRMLAIGAAALVLGGILIQLRGRLPQSHYDMKPAAHSLPAVSSAPRVAAIASILPAPSSPPVARATPSRSSEVAAASPDPSGAFRQNGPAARVHPHVGKLAPSPLGMRGAQGSSKTQNCDPPTYLDPDGIRIFKDGCL